jgi:CRISPR-associated endoribonuclease Cas2 subtype I-E
MTILMLRTKNKKLRGKLTKILYKASNSLFFGDVSKTVRDLLWKDVSEDVETHALMLFNANTEQGFIIQASGSFEKKILSVATVKPCPLGRGYKCR